MPEPSVGIVYRMDRMGGVQSVVTSLIRGLNGRGIVPDILWDQPPDHNLLAGRGLQAGYQPLAYRVRSTTLDRLPDSLRYLAKVANVTRSSQVGKAYDFLFIFSNGFLVDDGTPHVRYLSGPPLLPQLSRPPRGLAGFFYRLAKTAYLAFLRHSRPAYEYHEDSPYVINSHYTARLFKEAHGVDLPVVHPPIDVSGRSYDPADLHRRDTLTFFSRIVDYKRPDFVLALAGRHPELRVVVMGGVPEHRRLYFESLKQRARAYGRDDVIFLANPSNERVNEELARTRFYVFPAANEHFGMTTVEAIASGAVPYVHNSGGQREIVPFRELRFDDEHFSEGFDRLAAVPEEALNEFRRRLKAHIDQFSEQHFIDEMLAYLNGSGKAAR